MKRWDFSKHKKVKNSQLIILIESYILHITVSIYEYEKFLMFRSSRMQLLQETSEKTFMGEKKR